jgi:hypothetical protein
MADEVVKKSDLEALEARMDAHMEALEARMEAHMEALEIRLLERIEKSETNLLKEFRKWAMIAESRLRTNEVGLAGLMDRTAALEGRVNDLEQR